MLTHTFHGRDANVLRQRSRALWALKGMSARGCACVESSFNRLGLIAPATTRNRGKPA